MFRLSYQFFGDETQNTFFYQYQERLCTKNIPKLQKTNGIMRRGLRLALEKSVSMKPFVCLHDKINLLSFPIGLTWEEAKKRCPAGVIPACHNAVDTVTVSGPEKIVLDFVDELKAEGVFAKAVNSAGTAFHSKYMADIAPSLKAALDKVQFCFTQVFK
jgi:acyl transferase domain-containing protein